MEIQKINLNNIDQELISKVASVIESGGVVVVPTDTVYGLVCDATNKEAVDRIYKIKKRDSDKPIGIFVSDIKMAKKYAKIESDQESLLKTANTYVLSSEGTLSFGDTLGVRLPKNKLILELIREIGAPLAQTSANISGESSTNNIKETVTFFKSQKIQPDLILDAGELPERKASKVVDLTGDGSRIIRN